MAQRHFTVADIAVLFARHLRLIRAFFAVALVALVAPSAAQALTCNAVADGSWSDAATWSGCGGGVPTATDDVTIDNTRSLTISDARTVHDLSLRSPLTGATGNAKLTVTGALTSATPSQIGLGIHGTLQLVAGTFTKTGQQVFQIDGTATVTAKTTTIDGTGNVEFSSSGRFIVPGTADALGAGTFQITTNASNITIGSESVDSRLEIHAGGVLTNAQQSARITVPIQNAGTIALTGNSTNVSLQPVDQTLSGNFVVGADDVMAFRNLNLTSGVNISGDGIAHFDKVTAPSGVDITAKTVRIQGFTLGGAGAWNPTSIQLLSGQFETSRPSSPASFEFSGTLAGSQTITSPNCFVGAGSGIGRLEGTAHVTCGTYTHDTYDEMTVAGQSTLTVTTATLGDGGAAPYPAGFFKFEGDGTLEITGSGHPAGAGTLTVMPSFARAAFGADSGASGRLVIGVGAKLINNGAILNVGTVVNNGTIQADGTGSGSFRAGVTLTGAGSYVVGAGAELRIEGVTLPSGSSVSGAGSVVFQGARINDGASVTSPNVTVWGGGLTILGSGGWNPTTLTLDGPFSSTRDSTPTLVDLRNSVLSGSQHIDAATVTVWPGFGFPKLTETVHVTAGTFNDGGNPILSLRDSSVLTATTANLDAKGVDLGNESRFEIAAAGTLNIFDSAVAPAVRTAGGGTLVLGPGAKILQQSGALVVVQTPIEVGAGSTFSVPAGQSLQATVQVPTGATLSIPAGAGSLSGTVNVNGGTVNVADTLTAPVVLTAGGVAKGSGTYADLTNTSGIVRPGNSPGTLNVSGNFAQGPAGTMEVEIDGVTPGTQYDRLNVSGSASLNGTLTIIKGAAFSPAATDTFQIIQAAARNGTFSTVTGTSSAAGDFSTAYDGTPGTRLLFAPAVGGGGGGGGGPIVPGPTTPSGGGTPLTDPTGPATPSQATPAQSGADADADGIPDSADNCSAVANADQSDVDNDGIGDTCDDNDGSRPPVLGISINARVLSGVVLIKYPKGTGQPAGFVQLRGAALIPIGSRLDATKGKVQITSSLGTAAAAGVQTGTFSGGQFDIRQKKAQAIQAFTDIVLAGGSFAGCPKPTLKAVPKSKRSKPIPATAAAASAKKKKKSTKVRAVFGDDAGGKFRTEGRNSAGTVRGTSWSTTDRCDGTLTNVTKGSVSVLDYGLWITKTVKTGKSYLALNRKGQRTDRP